MLFISILILIMAMALHSPKFNSILFIRIAAIVLIYAGALSFSAFYIQSIGSGIGVFSSQFHVTTVYQLLDTVIFTLGSLILIAWSSIPKSNLVWLSSEKSNLLIFKIRFSIKAQAADKFKQSALSPWPQPGTRVRAVRYLSLTTKSKDLLLYSFFFIAIVILNSLDFIYRYLQDKAVNLYDKFPNNVLLFLLLPFIFNLNFVIALFFYYYFILYTLLFCKLSLFLGSFFALEFSYLINIILDYNLNFLDAVAKNFVHYNLDQFEVRTVECDKFPGEDIKIWCNNAIFKEYIDSFDKTICVYDRRNVASSPLYKYICPFMVRAPRFYLEDFFSLSPNLLTLREVFSCFNEAFFIGTKEVGDPFFHSAIVSLDLDYLSPDFQAFFEFSLLRSNLYLNDFIMLDQLIEFPSMYLDDETKNEIISKYLIRKFQLLDQDLNQAIATNNFDILGSNIKTKIFLATRYFSYCNQETTDLVQYYFSKKVLVANAPFKNGLELLKEIECPDILSKPSVLNKTSYFKQLIIEVSKVADNITERNIKSLSRTAIVKTNMHPYFESVTEHQNPAVNTKLIKPQNFIHIYFNQED